MLCLCLFVCLAVNHSDRTRNRYAQRLSFVELRFVGELQILLRFSLIRPSCPHIELPLSFVGLRFVGELQISLQIIACTDLHCNNYKP